MKHIFKKPLLLIFLLLPFWANAQIFVDEGEGMENSLLSDDDIIFDSTAVAFEMWFFQKYEFDVPASGIYDTWDTMRVHPYETDTSLFNDTIALALVNIELGQFFTPPRIDIVTSNFGPRKYRYHYGIDIDCETGDSIFTAFDGMIRMVAKSKSYGNVVVIRHYNGLETIYAHLSKTKVTVNQEVKSGDVIGLGGNTGRSYGSHLHFEIRYLGNPLNPNDLIDFSSHTLKSDTLVLTKKNFQHIIEAKTAKYHVIRKGDTLSRIARKYGTSVSSLCKMNKISVKTKLSIGRRLRVG
ncbi:MAG: peptidoglycan DD-metalloendopeptidase family protein [Bacteroidetes bacterium]|nr:peptidoglycan DD-metalloendopeptidase family protein [Bacteroidota bacterium]MBU1720715.1 peptidoglycan DD-metalloendopeptidase family protein [Bacteroidota bacterium]